MWFLDDGLCAHVCCFVGIRARNTTIKRPMDTRNSPENNEVSNKLVWNEAKTIATIGENTTWEITETELV
jgi:hypothetical protein